MRFFCFTFDTSESNLNILTMKNARIVLLTIMAACLVATMFVENNSVTYEGTYLSTDGVTPLFTLFEHGKGVVHQNLAAGLSVGKIQWRNSSDNNSLEMKQGDNVINVILVGQAKELGFPVAGRKDDLLHLKSSGTVTTFHHIASRMNTDSLQLATQAASIK